ncbi:hypothetical protein F5B21DRAFT_54431 [Xylaria acuta]|nr:hypothetical protein F5B21DRAFT_54431 [Xylaria acuta]
MRVLCAVALFDGLYARIVSGDIFLHPSTSTGVACLVAPFYSYRPSCNVSKKRYIMVYPEVRFDGEMGERQRHTLGDGGRDGRRKTEDGGRRAGEERGAGRWSARSRDGDDVGGPVSYSVAGSRLKVGCLDEAARHQRE